MRIALVFDKVRDDTIGIYFERACRQLGLPYEHFWSRDSERIPAGFDLYLRIDHGDYTRDLPERLRPRVLYATDTHLPHAFRGIKRMAARYDLVCCAHRQGAEALRHAVWVPVGCDPELHASAGLPKRWDVAFIGTEGGVPRKFLLQALRERYPNSLITHAPHTELGRIYGQARVGFNYSIGNDINMRMFEVLAAGTLLITNQLSHDDLDTLGLRDREQLVLYRRPADLFGLIDRYLEQEQEREAIAARGREAVLQGHTYADRLKQIGQLATARLGVKLIGQTVEHQSCACS